VIFPLPFATTLFKYFIVEKLVLNVLSLTVGVLAELTIGNARAVNVPAKAIAARALLFLNFIFSPTLQWHPNDANIVITT
jgi:ABC-type uncharacterized transport system YnjBCD substrate-binding protein